MKAWLFEFKCGIKMGSYIPVEVLCRYLKKGNESKLSHEMGNGISRIKEFGISILSHNALQDYEGVCVWGGRSVFDEFSCRGSLKDPRKIQFDTTSLPATFIAFDSSL